MRKTNLVIGIFFVCIFVVLAKIESKQTDKVDAAPTGLKTNNNDSLILENSFTQCEEMPGFPGGEMGLLKFIDKNIDKKLVGNPELKEGRCIVRFQIDTLGNTSGFIVAKSYSHAVDSEFVRVLKLMPRWTPGRLLDGHKGTWVKTPIFYTMPLKLPYKRIY